MYVKKYVHIPMYYGLYIVYVFVKIINKFFNTVHVYLN